MMRYLLIFACLLFTGCAMLPELSRQPSLHNPFPQITKVAVAPFFNLSHEPTLDGRRVAVAYFNELQLVPGFEVTPVGVVEQKLREHQITLNDPSDARRLAQILDVDAMVIGAVTDYTPYYPPRLAMQVEWYAANPCFHQIPPGYGLPVGTREERDIPGSLIFEARMAAARAELESRTPKYERLAAQSSAPKAPPPLAASKESTMRDSHGLPAQDRKTGASFQPPPVVGMPIAWPGRRVPEANSTAAPICQPTDKPVMQHTRAYNGNDDHFVEALRSYHYFREDARLGGWQGYLQRSDDFLRFCCHMNIWEMLSARGGAGPSHVVWRWPRKCE